MANIFNANKDTKNSQCINSKNCIVLKTNNSIKILCKSECIQEVFRYIFFTFAVKIWHSILISEYKSINIIVLNSP